MTPLHVVDTYTPLTGERCRCRPGVWRDNCPTCEGTGWVIDFRAIHARREHERMAIDEHAGERKGGAAGNKKGGDAS